MLDDVSRRVCSIIDPAELTRNTHPSPEWRSGAEDAFTNIGNVIDELNADVGIYESACGIGEGDLDAEDRLMLWSIMKEYENDGIHLPSSVRDEAVGIKGRITNLETEYVREAGRGGVFMYEDKGGWGGRIFGVDTMRAIGEAAGGDRKEQIEGGVYGVTEGWFSGNMIRLVHEEGVRREVYYHSHCSAPGNLEVLEELRRERNELARVTGYGDWCEKAVKGKMAEGRVRGFLEKCKGKAKRGWKVRDGGKGGGRSEATTYCLAESY